MPYRWFKPAEGTFTIRPGEKSARTADFWVLKNPRATPGTVGTDITAETTPNKHN